MGLYGSEKRQALPEELFLIIAGLRPESGAIWQVEIGGNGGRQGFKAGRISRFKETYGL
jgi:hypothetical protein